VTGLRINEGSPRRGKKKGSHTLHLRKGLQGVKIKDRGEKRWGSQKHNKRYAPKQQLGKRLTIKKKRGIGNCAGGGENKRFATGGSSDRGKRKEYP